MALAVVIAAVTVFVAWCALGHKRAALNCRDSSRNCKINAVAGKCHRNDSMLLECPVSCHSCHMIGSEGLQPLDAHGAPVPCIDKEDRCQEWALRGECQANSAFMLFNCANSCRSCWRLDYKLNECRDAARDCSARAASGKCKRNDTMLLECPVSCSSCHMVDSYGLVAVDRDGKQVACVDSDDRCAGWAQVGECDANPHWMQYNCPKACKSCWRLDYMSTCAEIWATPTALQPGSLDALFGRYAEAAESHKAAKLAQCTGSLGNETCVNPGSDAESQDSPVSLTKEELQEFKPTVLSAPPEGPWIVQFDNFLTESECAYLIEWMSTVNPYENSSEASPAMQGGKIAALSGETSSQRRTSQSAWCKSWKCMVDPVVRRVSERIERLTGVPANNSEHLQLLRYLPTQRYVEHHDFLEAYDGFPVGPRIMTLFVYLSNVEAGGETRFTSLPAAAEESDRRSVKVTPQVGRAVLWPNVLNHDIQKKDDRTKHEAVPVEQGVKYGMNAWLHLRNYREAFDIGCAGV